MTAPFRASYPLRFAHCDPAGIAYYPRYFELVDAAIEDWTAAVLPVSRAAMHRDHGFGMPTVDLHARFAAVSRYGDLLDIGLDVVRVGHSSVDLEADVRCNGEPRFSVHYTQVLINLETARPVPWPETWRAALEHRS